MVLSYRSLVVLSFLIQKALCALISAQLSFRRQPAMAMKLHIHSLITLLLLRTQWAGGIPVSGENGCTLGNVVLRTTISTNKVLGYQTTSGTPSHSHVSLTRRNFSFTMRGDSSSSLLEFAVYPPKAPFVAASRKSSGFGSCFASPVSYF
jgi:hypothetical protein